MKDHVISGSSCIDHRRREDTFAFIGSQTRHIVASASCFFIPARKGSRKIPVSVDNCSPPMLLEFLDADKENLPCAKQENGEEA